MDDAKYSYITSSLLISILALALTTNAAVELEYVSPEIKAELAKKFEQAEFSNQAEIKHKQWTCDMYGVRTGLQVKRGVKLYKFENQSDWHNKGAQLVSDYSVQGSALTGVKQRFEDNVKLTSKGELISRLSLIEKPENQVLAYSVCTATP